MKFLWTKSLNLEHWRNIWDIIILNCILKKKIPLNNNLKEEEKKFKCKKKCQRNEVCPQN